MELQPIETAPKDGTRLLGYGDKPAFFAAMEFRNGLWWRDSNGYGFVVSFHPTHWVMPLPDPPAPTARRNGEEE